MDPPSFQQLIWDLDLETDYLASKWRVPTRVNEWVRISQNREHWPFSSSRRSFPLFVFGVGRRTCTLPGFLSLVLYHPIKAMGDKFREAYMQGARQAFQSGLSPVLFGSEHTASKTPGVCHMSR